MNEPATFLAPRPAHVPESLVRDFDFYDIEGSEVDVHAAYVVVQRANPDIFWTPRNGGHWVATRGEDIVHIQTNPDQFSSETITLPKLPEGTPRLIPIELDPPILGQYRRPVIQALTPGFVRQLEEKVRQIAVEQIDRLLPLGECEFIKDFSKVMPIHVFLDLVALPREDRDFLLSISEVVARSPDPLLRQDASLRMGAYLQKWVAERRANPGPDLLSRIATVEIDGQAISEDEAIGYATLLLFGGLDTVAGMIGFFTKFLAENPDHRRRLVENINNEPFLNAAVEELIRRYGVSNVGRVARGDFNYKGVEFRDGDLVLPPNLLVGIDDRVNADPLTVDFGRKRPTHAAFGNGAHACPGANLARRELRVFLQEWLARIPEFRIKPGSTPQSATGGANALVALELVWP